MFGNAVDMTAICGDGGFRQSLCGLGNYEIIEHIWLGGQEYSIYFAAGNSGFYYNALDGWVSSEDPEFDVVYSSEPAPLKVQQWDGKNYTEKYYTIILNTNTMKLKVLQDRGERFCRVLDPHAVFVSG